MKHREIIFTTLFFMTLGQLATDIYLPSFPYMAQSLHTNINTIQLSFSVFLAFFGLSQLIYGPLIERFGRKPWLLFGLSVYCVMSLIASFSTSAYQLLLIRSIQGLGAGACSVIPRAIMRDVFSNKKIEKLAVYQSLVWSLIPILAPLLGSYIQSYLGWRYNFMFLFFISSIALFFAMRYSETLVKPSTNLTINNLTTKYLAVLKNKQFSLPLLCAVGTISLLTLFNVSSPIIMQQYLGLTPLQYGWSLVAIASAFMIGILINHQLMRYVPSQLIETIGISITLLATMSFLLSTLLVTTNFYVLLSPIFLLQLGCALIFPGSAAKTMNAYPENGGVSAAVLGSSLFLGSTLTSSLAALLPHTTLIPIALLMLTISLIVLTFHNLIGVNHDFNA